MAQVGFLDVNSEEENGVLEEDDEEIDSDEAWDEADEHRFADLLPGKRRLLAARTEAVPESAYSAAGSGGHKVRVEDLLAGLGQTGASYTDLRNTAKTLSDVKRAHARDGSGGGGASKRKGAPLQAPLPSILQDRIDRAAAHEQSKAEVEGWAPTIKRLREAEHLSFPLQDDKMVPQSVAALTSSENVKPTNDMERSIAALLAQEGMTDRNKDC
ncbi:Uncharacterized conserved protein [Ceraceosorus bombacis]|uniref:Uncharacterized conserved protein n=1 Tax=Ceraceosorus bombacis TaxID=401625 RepID=A0A0P1BKY9_9BASI|nr:Uncharacterized conserved protein [Ceraceosorus bombacis]